MATINTRLLVQSQNLFTNAFALRSDKALRLTGAVEKTIKTITSTTSGAATTILAVTDFGADKDVFVFLKNRASATGKYLYVIIGSQQIMRLSPGQYCALPWRTESGDDLKVYGNDSNGIKLELLAGTTS